jgi:hypothetical protein
VIYRFSPPRLQEADFAGFMIGFMIGHCLPCLILIGLNKGSSHICKRHKRHDYGMNVVRAPVELNNESSKAIHEFIADHGVPSPRVNEPQNFITASEHIFISRTH